MPLIAPGEIYITEVLGGTDVDQGEFSMKFALCKDVFGYFNHIKTLSDVVKELIKDIDCEQWTHNPANICARRLVHRVEAGTELGGVGDLQGNFDFGAYDYRTALEYVNGWRFGNLEATGTDRPRSLSIVCPLDLYDSETRGELYGKVARAAEPKCGEVMQDVPGTLQGNWFQGDAIDAPWDRQLAFVHDNHDPSKAVTSVGGFFTGPGKWEFTPQTFGSANRDFSDVTPDGNVYCYDQGQPGRILLQLTAETELSIEHQSGSCADGALQFSSPVTYTR